MFNIIKHNPFLITLNHTVSKVPINEGFSFKKIPATLKTKWCLSMKINRCKKSNISSYLQTKAGEINYKTQLIRIGTRVGSFKRKKTKFRSRKKYH